MLKNKLKSAVLSASTLTVLSAGAVAAQEACTNYSVSDGDTLATISIAAYGTSNYQPIFNANRDNITNPNNLKPGLILALPCNDGSLPNGQSAREVIANEEARNADNQSTNIYEAPIRMVLGDDWAPFADESMNGGGMMARLASTALRRGGNNREHSISFVDDWASHLSTLLPLGAFDVSLGWYMPDCSNKSYEWGENTTMRCTEFDVTVPVYDSVIGFFTLAESEYANAQSFEDFHGATICRTEGWFTFDLEQVGLVSPNISMMQPRTSVECMDAVLNGTADVVSFEVELAADILAQMGVASGEIVENAYLNNILSLHFFAHKSNPHARKYVALLNRGLIEMRESGEWYAIVSDTLREANKRTISN
ncbi:transporter substrate-binding domain-containing protein [Ruegeria atlantica]|uniref:transporter substrate-binding domain-containing protein n=1 Tax=Ruegeria atlantica TaxID=81569 RepID=UPI00147E843D|nr:transporter substrate-binding domain-containing protein [Ruegeria atlantica]